MVQKTNKRARGRPRAYDPHAALTEATKTFWRKGYSATSMDDLSAATDMNRPSLYNAFGDKHALYLTTLERYVVSGRKAMDLALDYERPLSEALQRVYDAALSLYFPQGDTARGCFLIGTAVTEAVHDEEVRTILSQGLREFDSAFEARLKHAQAQGELDGAADVVALAKIASAVLHTLALRSRAGDSRASLRATANAGVQLICEARRTKTAKKRHRLL
jgi:TetR/AcrR family transcriptional regulator, copper-responsive repressor